VPLWLFVKGYEMNNTDKNDRRVGGRRLTDGASLGKVKIEVSSEVLTVFVIVLSFAAIVLLWLYAQQTAHIRLIVFFLSLIIIVSVVVFIDQVQKRQQLHKLQLRQLITQRTSELETARAAAETARLQAEQINRQLQASVGHANLMAQQAMDAGQSKNEFLAEISHQIRIPMNAIIGFSEMLADDNLTEQQKKQVGIILESSRQLLQLINDILDFSKIEAGNLEIEIAECTLESVLAAVESLMRPLATEKSLQFEIIRSQPLPEFIRTDSTRLKQCLINLVSIAVRFTERGYVYVRVFWDNSGSNPFIRFDVECTQSVLSSERQQYVFGRSGAARLGLTITQRLAEFLEGSVTIGSLTGKGSVFTLTIPIGMPPAPQAAAARRVDAAAKKLSAQMIDSLKLGGRVLLAEDSPTNQALVELLLKKLGVEVVIVENGQQAVQKALAEKFDVILMDIQMPVMDGYEATNQLRKNGVKVPIIALTAYAMKGDDEKCFAAGCSDHLSKPIDRKKLIVTIMKYLAVKGLSHDPSVAALAKTEASQNSPAAGVVQPLAAAGIEIDWQLLMERIGSQELVDEIVPIFMKDNTERMKMLSQAVEKNDEREIKFYAHSIKGAAATIGATGISEIARQLEAAVRDLDNSKYKSMFEELSVRFIRLVDFLSKDDWKQAAQQASSRQHTEKS